MIIGRRSFLAGLLAAPIIVRPGILMPVKPMVLKPPALTINDFARLYIEPAMRKLEAQLTAEFTRDFWKPTAYERGLGSLLA